MTDETLQRRSIIHSCRVSRGNAYHRALPALLLAWLLAGACASPPISRSVRMKVDPELSFAQLRADPHSYLGRGVLLGGEILQTRNTTEGTFILMLQRPLGPMGTPRGDDESGGRFIILESRFLDPVIYRRGRRLVVAGEVVGKLVGRVDAMEYTYPVIQAQEIHLCKRSHTHHGFFEPYPATESLLDPGMGAQPFDIVP